MVNPNNRVTYPLLIIHRGYGIEIFKNNHIKGYRIMKKVFTRVHIIDTYSRTLLSNETIIQRCEEYIDQLMNNSYNKGDYYNIKH